MYSLPPETHAAFTRWNAPLSDMCKWWCDGGMVQPQLTFKDKESGGVIATISDDCSVALWSLPAPQVPGAGDTNDGSLTDLQPLCRSVEDNSGGIYSLAVSRDGLCLATCSKDKSINLYDVCNSRLSLLNHFPDSHDDVVKDVSFAPDSGSRVLASCGKDKVVKVWDSRQRAPVMELPNWHTNTINSIKYHPSRPDVIMTCGFDQVVKLTDLRYTRISGGASGNEQAELRAFRLKDDRGGQIIHPHWWLGGRYIVVPEDKGNELVCISAFGPTAGERVGIAHPVSTCPSSMAVDDRSGAFVFALRQKIFVSALMTLQNGPKNVESPCKLRPLMMMLLGK